MAYLNSSRTRRTSLSYPLFHPRHPDAPPLFLDAPAFSAAFAGEGDHLEFKQGVSTQRFQAAAVAFSNTDGGVLVAGVSPDGRVVGVANPGEKAKDIHQAFRDVENPGRYEVRELQVDDKTVLVVAVDRRHEGFAQTPAGVVLVRRGASNTALLGPDLSMFLARRTFTSFELTPTDIPASEADPDLRRRLCDAYSCPDDDRAQDRMAETGFVTVERQEAVLTVAGALLLVPEPKRMGGRPYIDVRRYAEGEPDPDRVWEIVGPADDQIEQAAALVKDELGSVSAIVGTRRVELPRLPERALREAIANAVAHRSYENAGTAIRIDIHPSHVTITSPGGLPEPVTIEHIRVQQAARNDRLLGALRRFHLAEDQGQGIDRIEDDMALNLLHAPEFATDGSFFSITLQLGGVVTARERAWVRGLIDDDQLDPRSALVLVEIARNGSTTNGQVRELLDVDSVVARSVLQGLVREGILVQIGERGGAEYRIDPSVSVPARIRHTDAELDQIALDMAAEVPLTNALLRRQTGLDAVQARKVLRRLVERGELVQRGSRRGTRYEAAGS